MTLERQQTRLLTRTFFGRLFETDLMPAGLAPVHLVTGVIAFLAAPAVTGPVLLSKKYFTLLGSPDLLHAASAKDRTLVLLLSMLATALVTLVIWENIFPDRRDSRTLGVLPIRVRSFVVARMTALMQLFALLFLGTTALSSVTFAVLAAVFVLPGGFFGTLVGHFLAVAGAEAFVFFAIIALQCGLMNLSGPSVAHRVAIVLQLVLVVSLLQMPSFLPDGHAFGSLAGSAPGWATLPNRWMLPPLWFLALFDAIAIGGYAESSGLARLAAAVATGTPLLALVMYAASYRRLTRLAIEGRPMPRVRHVRAMPRIVAWCVSRVTFTPASHAVCAFTLRTLVRSRQHRMLLAGWIGIAVALIVSSLVPLIVRFHGTAFFDRPQAAVLAAPLVLAALSLAGTRMLFALPTEIKANWTFRLREPVKLVDALSGASAALAVVGAVPGALLAFVSAGWLWGGIAGIQHAVFCAAMGLLAVQILMRGVDKVPFTCTYYPGKAQFTKFWPVYLVAFSTFTYTAAYLEARLLGQAGAYLAALGVLLTIIAFAAWTRRRDSSQLVSLRFEEEPLDSLTLVSF